MKVVMITHDRKIDRRIIQEAKSLTYIGYQVSIVAFPWSGEEDKDIGDIKIVRASDSSAARNIFTSIKSIYSLFRKQLFNKPKLMFMIRNYVNGCLLDLEKYFENFLLELAISEHGDIYHAHDLPSLSSAYKASRLYNTPLVYDSHELYCGQEFGKLEAAKWRKIESRYICETDAVITVNSSIAELLAKWYGCKEPLVIMNKINIFDSCPDDDKKTIHRILGLDLDTPIFLYQGGITQSRNLESLVLAMRKVKNNAVLVFLGEGTSKENLVIMTKKNRLENKVFFIDEVSQDKLLKYTSSADIGLIPYLGGCLNSYYCTPNKLFEFISSGIPLLANDLPEIRKIIMGEEIGNVSDFSNPDEIAVSMDQMLGDKILMLKYKQNIEKIKDRYTWDYEQEKLIKLYNKLNTIR